MRVIDIADTFTSSTTPTVTGANAKALEVYANDAAYESAYTPAEGSVFYDSTLNKMKIYDGAVWRTNEETLDNATGSDPDADEDAADGYAVLSLWLNTSTGALFRCTDATTGAAVWQEIAKDSVLDSHIAATEAHGASGAVVGTTNTQTLTTKTFSDEITFAEITTPTTPTSGQRKIYPKNDGKFYQLKDDGTEAELGAGGGGGGLDTIHTEDFELANAFVTGNNAAPDAAGTGAIDSVLSDDTSTELSGTQSLKMVLGSSADDDFIINSEDIPLAAKHVGNYIGTTFYYKLDDADDSVRFFVLDQDDVELTSTTEYLKNATIATRFSTAVYIPSGTTAIRYGWQVVSGANTKILLIDDVEISSNPFTYKNLVIKGSYRANGHAGYGSTNNKIPYFSTISLNEITQFGSIVNNSTDGWSFTATRKCTVSVSYLGTSGGATDQYGTSLNSNQLTTAVANITQAHRVAYDIPASAGQNFHVSRTIEMAVGDVLRPHTSASTPSVVEFGMEVSATTEHVVTPAIAGSESYYADTHAGYGSTATKIPYFTNERINTVSKLGSASNDSTNGWKFTASKACVVDLHYIFDGNSEAIGISLNSSQLTTNIPSIAIADRVAQLAGQNAGKVSCSIPMVSGDILRLHNQGQSASNAGFCTVTMTVRPKEATFLAAVPTTVREMYDASGSAGYGSTDTKINYFTTINTNTISKLGTVTNDSTNGWKFTASRNCKMNINYLGTMGGATNQIGISVNSNQLTTNIANITAAHRVAYDIPASAGQGFDLGKTRIINAGDVVRVHGAGETISVGEFRFEVESLGVL